jgi:heat shock protein HslJ
LNCLRGSVGWITWGIFFLLAAQASAQPLTLEGRWLLEASDPEFSIPQAALGVPAARVVRVEFTALPNATQQGWTVNIEAQCNSFGTRLKMGGDTELRFTDMITTAQYCPDWRREFDRSLTSLFYQTERIEQTAEGLTLYGNAGVMHFRLASD